MMATGTTGARITAGRRRTTTATQGAQSGAGLEALRVDRRRRGAGARCRRLDGQFISLGAARRASRIGTDTDPNRIAVLYFDDQSEGGKLRPLADGLTDALIDQLSAVKQLKVISRNGVAPFKGKNDFDGQHPARAQGRNAGHRLDRTVRAIDCACRCGSSTRRRELKSTRRRSTARAPTCSNCRTTWRNRCRCRCGSRSGTRSRTRVDIPAHRTRPRGKRISRQSRTWPASTRS